MNDMSRAGFPPGKNLTIQKGERWNMAYFNAEAYESLLMKVKVSEEKDDPGVLADVTEDFLTYVETVCRGENQLNTAKENDRNIVSDYDAKRHNAHENAIVAASVLNRLAGRFGVEPVFTGDIADRHQVADFCLEIAGWLFVNRRRVL